MGRFSRRPEIPGPGDADNLETMPEPYLALPELVNDVTVDMVLDTVMGDRYG